jgi:hypothetical protein
VPCFVLSPHQGRAVLSTPGIRPTSPCCCAVLRSKMAIYNGQTSFVSCSCSAHQHAGILTHHRIFLGPSACRAVGYSPQCLVHKDPSRSQYHNCCSTVLLDVFDSASLQVLLMTCDCVQCGTGGVHQGAS